MRCVNLQEVFKHPILMLHRYLNYYCLTDINREIKEVIFNFSLCKVRECKLRHDVNWQEVFKPKTQKKTGSKQGLEVYTLCDQILQIKSTSTLYVVLSPAVCLLQLTCFGP